MRTIFAYGVAGSASTANCDRSGFSRGFWPKRKVAKADRSENLTIFHHPAGSRAVRAEIY